jgi:hypothetical protein
MTEQGKTLGQLNVQPGDVVRCVDDGGRPWWTVGKKYPVYESEDGPIIKNDDGDPRLIIPEALFTIASRNEVNPSQDGASIPPADPAPVTWPDGVDLVRLLRGVELKIARNALSISGADGLYGEAALRQLAALLIAAANHVEGK